MSTDAQMNRVLTEVAETIVDDYDVSDVLTTLADRCVDLLGIRAAGFLLVSPPRTLSVMASSSGPVPFLVLMEQQTREGPCLDCFEAGGPIIGHDLASAESTRRWPTFAPAARAAGFRGADAIPMRLRHQSIGVLSMLRDTPTAPDAAGLAVAQTLADLATVAVLQQDAARHGVEAVDRKLDLALHDRIIIEQAKGMVAERDGVDIDEAFARIRRRAHLDRHRLAEVAADIVDGTLNPAALAPVSCPT
ncbi:MAG: GAF and ANTAR domain-containing protein [Ilumatobacteraceae bacterium]